MSGLGRGDAAQIGRETADVVREVVRELERLARAARDAAGGAFGGALGAAGAGFRGGVGAAAGAVQRAAEAGGGGGAAVAGSLVGGPAGAAAGLLLDNPVTNAASRAARSFAVDTAIGVANDRALFGNGVSFSQSVTDNAIRAAASLPIFGDVVAQVADPVDAARARVTAIATTVARAGGKLGADELRGLTNAFLPEEQRAKQAETDVKEFFKTEGIAGSAIEGTRLAELLDELVRIAPGLVDAMTTFANAVNGWFGGGPR